MEELRIYNIKFGYTGIMCHNTLQLKQILELLEYPQKDFMDLSFPVIVSCRSIAIVDPTASGFKFVQALDVIKANPKPLFTTQDGFPIFNGECCYIIRSTSKAEFIDSYYGIWLGSGHQALYFKRREKALEYLKNRHKITLSAVELQDQKTAMEIRIIALLNDFNKICVDNGFQVSGLNYSHDNTDQDRKFEIDIQIE